MSEQTVKTDENENKQTTTTDEIVPQVIDHHEEIAKAHAWTSRTTRERLIDALKETKMPVWMILRAELGEYDFDGRIKLLKDLNAKGNTGMIERIAAKEFDHDLRDMQALFAKAQREGRPVNQQQQAQKAPSRRERKLNECLYNRSLKKIK